MGHGQLPSELEVDPATETPTAVLADAEPVSGEVCLDPTCPNPFNASTAIRYRLFEPVSVRLAVYNLTGQLLRVLADEHQAPGAHEITWDGRSADGGVAATGVYLVRLESPAGVRVRKVTLLR
jgi:hypothetical protein